MRRYEAQTLKVGTKVQVKVESEEWVEATVIESASSENRRRPIVLLPSGQIRAPLNENIRLEPST